MEKPLINVDDVNYALSDFKAYQDCYSTGIIEVFQSYLEHTDFLKTRGDLELVHQVSKPRYLLWDINTNISFPDVIYPIMQKGGQDV
ncbi:hypothetical protein [Pedobacter ginsengisoli]|nr:hypothetical protein [Pedobacter ginsengisoli]